MLEGYSRIEINGIESTMREYCTNRLLLSSIKPGYEIIFMGLTVEDAEKLKKMKGKVLTIHREEAEDWIKLYNDSKIIRKDITGIIKHVRKLTKTISCEVKGALKAKSLLLGLDVPVENLPLYRIEIKKTL